MVHQNLKYVKTVLVVVSVTLLLHCMSQKARASATELRNFIPAFRSN